MTYEEIIQALRCTSTPGSLHEDCTGCPYYRKEKLDAELKEKLGVDTWPSCDVNKVGMDAADLIERLTAENEELRKEIEWKDMVISLAQRKQADAEADRDALLGKWISVDEKLPELGTRVIATDGVFVGEAIFARDSRWSGYGGGILRDCIGGVVTHWMPLPAAPEEGEKHE